MTRTVIVGTDAYLIAAKQLVDRGVLTESQYQQMEYRNSRLPKEVRYNTVILT